jgi:hypothetical protein
MDVNDDGRVDISDAVALADFIGGTPPDCTPPPPAPLNCGEQFTGKDPTGDDGLVCEDVGATQMCLVPGCPCPQP